MRAVLDTNVLVSGLLKPRGNERLVLGLALRRKFVTLVSEPIWTEYEVVLRRPELKLQAAEVERTISELRKVADFVSPIARWPTRRMNQTIDSWNAPSPVMRTIW